MSKIDVNNEIVLMRHSVRKARIHIVRKLIKQVKIFGEKKGDDKQREKYKRKADRIGEELAVLKKLKDDEISRYSITNDRNLQEILTDQKSDGELRALARLAGHKVLMDRVVKFKEKFPNYEEHLGPGKRKLMKLKRKAGKQAKKEAKVTAKISEETEEKEKEKEGIIEQENSNSDNDSVESKKDIDVSLSEDDENIEVPEPPEERIESRKRKADKNCSSDIKRVKSLPEVKTREKLIKSIKQNEKVDDKLSGISLQNKESAVKSFSRFLEEKDEEIETVIGSIDKEIRNEDEIEIEKEVDSFFMTEDGSGEYLSVVVPKSKITENEEEEEEEEEMKDGHNSSSRSRNNRFFDKVDNRFDKTRKNINNSRDRNNFARGGGGAGDRFKDRNESRGFNNNNNRNIYNKDVKSKERDFTKSDKSITENNMHPSWAAKKKQQEILKLGFQGKKIVFDDDA